MLGRRVILFALGAAVAAGIAGLVPAALTRGEPPGGMAVTATPRAAEAEPAGRVRPTAVAGPRGRGFYPSDPGELEAALDEAFGEARPAAARGRVVGLMVPHAGYEFSAATAAAAYATVAGAGYDRVFLIGMSHHAHFDGAVVPTDDAWETPLGPVRVDREAVRALVSADRVIREDDGPHAEEHCLEVQLPLLRRALSDFRIVPVLLGEDSHATVTALAKAVAEVVRAGDMERSLLVASSDMAHYPPADQCRRVDERTLQAVCGMDATALYGLDRTILGEGVPGLVCTLCGLGAVATVMEASTSLGADAAEEVAYTNAGEEHPESADRAVGYGAVVFRATKQPMPVNGSGAEDVESGKQGRLTGGQRQQLLVLARETIAAHLARRPLPSIETDAPVLREAAAAFVTLTKGGRLRGCIGCTEAQTSLIETVREYAIAAATQDPRFPAMTPDELPETTIEISVLSPLQRVASADEVIVGTHGVMVRQGFRRGLFLPQVATEHHLSRDEFLTLLCAEKAGIAPDAWKGDAELFVFTVEKFREGETS